MKISILIPCWNEEKSIASCVKSCLDQTRPFDEIIVVNHNSTDNSGKILKTFGGKIKVIDLVTKEHNKSYAQEGGIKHVSGDIFALTDGDTIIDKDFAKRLEIDFKDPQVAAVGGYVKSLHNNWITTYRAYEYIIGQNLHKFAQSLLNYVFVIPGAAGAFRTEVFKKYLGFDHDTITEDLDFTYRLHKSGQKILYDRKAIVYTQDPHDLTSYVKQMRRWFGGGFQNLKKHLSADLTDDPRRVLELSLIYVEGIVFSATLIIVPFLNLVLATKVWLILFLLTAIQAIFCAFIEKRVDVLIVPFYYIFFMYLNAFIFLHQFIKQGISKDNSVNGLWFSPARVKI